MEITIGLYVLVSIIIAFASYRGYQIGVRRGASEMYEMLYKRGTRKNDHVIVELEYEDRSETKEF